MRDRDRDHPLSGADHLRLTPDLAQRAPGFKEWTYFFVSTPEIALLLTFTFLGRVDVRTVSTLPAARVVALARTRDGRWSGAVEELAPEVVRATPGRIDLAMGASELAFRAGEYVLRSRLDAAGIEARLHMRPVMQPAIGKSVRMGADQSMRWIVVPRLVARGEIAALGERHAIVDAAAYHDHNWGAFTWGGDFAWEWGLVLAESAGAPWTVVYSRICDRARRRVRSQAILVWDRRSGCHAFRDDEVAVEEAGLLRGGARLRVPPVMRLVEPARTADVPGTLVARAYRGEDWIEIRFVTEDFAELAIPNETPELGSTLLCEATARAAVRGMIDGAEFALRAPAVLELNHAASAPQGSVLPFRPTTSGRGPA
jgi:hypothetical protein